MNKTISVVVIESDERNIDYISSTLKSLEPQLHIIKFAASVQEGINAIKKHNPDIVFLDVNMTDEEGHTLLERLSTWDFEVIVLDSTEFYRLIAKENQKGGYIFKKIDISQLTNL